MVTTMPLQPGLLNLDSGTFSSIRIIQCVEDGDIVLLFPYDTDKNETVSFVAGQDAYIDGFSGLTIVSGKFHISR